MYVEEVHKGDDLGKHYIRALEKIKVMNTDRATVKKIVLLYNQK